MRGENGIGPDNGFEFLGLQPDAQAPDASVGESAAAPAQDVAPQPLTRRELREREAKRLAASAPAAPSAVVPPIPTPSFEVETQAMTAVNPAVNGAFFATPLGHTDEEPAAPAIEHFFAAPAHPAADARAAFPTRAAKGRGTKARVSSDAADAVPRGTRKRGVARRGRAAAVSGGPSSRPASTTMSRGAQVSSKLFSMGAMLFAAALMVGMSVPANAFITADTSEASVQTASVSLAKQSLEVSAEAVDAVEVRDAFSVTSYAEQLKAKYGSRSYDYNVTGGAIRWPFPYAVPISSGFGDRVAPCRSCSSNHAGLDFNPGEGAPIYAIADGVVSFTEVSNYGFGNHVFLTHTINGQKVESVYAHMQMNSIVVTTGQVVKAGDMLGLVGSTGQSTGAHLHFEIRLSGVAVDPFAWLKANAV